MEYVSYANREINDARISIYEQVYGLNWREIREKVFSLEREMIKAAQEDRYEDAAKLRDRIGSLEIRHCRFL